MLNVTLFNKFFVECGSIEAVRLLHVVHIPDV